MRQNLSYHLLTSKEVADIYRESHAFFRKMAVDFLNLEQGTLTNPETSISKLSEFFILCAQLNLNPNFFHPTILTGDSLNHTISQLRKTKNKDELLKPIEKTGLALRRENFMSPPLAFRHKSRLYFKINPILPYSKLLKEVIDYINSFLSNEDKLSLQEKEGRFFIQKENQLIRPIHFLRTLVTKTNQLRNILAQDEKALLSLKNALKNLSLSDLHNKNRLSFLRKSLSFLPARVDGILLLLLKRHPHFQQALLDFEGKIQSYQENLQSIAIRSEKHKSSDDFIDMIILSVQAHDIATMSTFTEWNSCMTIGSSFYQDICKQIGAGSIIAYGVNSKNPYKRLARILLRPYVSAKTYKKLKLLEEKYTSSSQSKFHTYLFDSVQEEEILNSIQADEVDLEHPFLPDRIYIPGKIYGLQSQEFNLIVQDIAQNMLDTPDAFGHMIVAQNMYLDGGDFTFYRYDPHNTDNLKDYLKSSLENYSISDDGIIHISYLDIRGKNDLHLKNIHVERLKITPEILEHPILENVKISSLVIDSASSIRFKQMPKALFRLQELVFNDEKRTFTLPNGIAAHRLIIEGFGAKSIPEDVLIDELIAPNTQLAHLPENLNLKVLNAAYCKNLRTFPKKITVSEKLDLSFTEISKLPPLVVKHLNLSGTKRFCKLPSHLKFQLLYMCDSALEELPDGLTAEMIILTCSALKSLPKGLKVHTLNVDSNPLKTLASDMKVDVLDASDTLISEIPENLSFKELIVADCPYLTQIPDTVQVSDMLNISNTSIKNVPILQLKELIAVRAKNLTLLPSGLSVQQINLNQSGIKRLPENLTAKSISAANSALEELPNGLTAERVVVSNTMSLKRIPQNLKVDYLYAQNTGIREVPKGLKFIKLSLEECLFLRHLPEDLKVQDHLSINNTSISNLPNTGAQYIDAQNCARLKRISNHIKCHTLNLFESAIEELPTHLEAQKLILSFTMIKKLPSNLKVGYLSLFETEVDELPPCIEVDEIDLSQTKISQIPANIHIQRIKKLDTEPVAIHFSPYIKEFLTLTPVQEFFVHPDYQSSIFASVPADRIQEAKKEYQNRFLTKKTSLIQKNKIYLSIDEERSYE